MKTKALKTAFPVTLPVMTGYLFLGAAFGIMLDSKGYGPGWAFFMSAIIYAGSGQFVAVELLASPFNLINAFIIELSLNARHLFYGLSMLKKFEGMGRRKPYMIFSLTDETYSLLCSTTVPEGVDEKWFRFFLSGLNHSYWIFGSVAGNVIGSALPVNTTGIDFVMTALFVVIFVGQWEENKDHKPALIGLAVTAICLIVVGPDDFIIASMVGIVVCLLLLKRMRERKTLSLSDMENLPKINDAEPQITLNCEERNTAI